MATGDLRAKLTIEAATAGSEKIEAMASDMESLAAAGGDAAPKFQLLAAELRGLAQQQGLISQFAELKKQTAAYAESAQQAQAQTKAAALALKEKRAASAEAVANEQRLSAALEQQRQAQATIGDSIATARNELKALSAASKAAGASASLYADQLAATKAKLEGLRTAYANAADQTRALATEQRAASAATRAIGADAKALEANFDRARAASAKANDAYMQGRVGLQSLREAMAAAGVSSDNLAEAQTRVRRQLAAASGQVVQMSADYRGVAGAAEQAASAQTRSARELSDKVKSISIQLGNLRNAYLAIQTLTAAGRAVGGLAETADQVSNLQARIKLVTGEGALFQQMWGQVAQTAQRTNSSLEATGNLFSRITTVGREAGLSLQAAAKQSLAVTETINQAIQLSGAAASASEAAITQLIQGLQSGVLRGDEFNSIMEQSPRLAKALADGLGVATGELRALAEAGELTSSKVIGALRSQAGAIRTEFESLPSTVGRSIENLNTAWSLFIDRINKANGASSGIAKAIDMVAANLDKLAVAALHVGATVVAMFAVKALMAARDFAAAQLGAAASLDKVAVSAARAKAGLEGVGASSNAAAAGMARFAGIAKTFIAVELINQLGTLAVAFNDLRIARARLAAAEAESAKQDAALAQRLREISDATGVTVGTWREFEAAVARGAIVANEATGKWQAAGASQTALAAAARGSAKDLQTLQEVVALTSFDKLVAEGNNAAIAISKLSESFNFSSASGIDAFINTLRTLGARAKLTSEEISFEWQRAIDSLRADQLGLVMDRVTVAFKSGAINAKTFADVNDKVLRASFGKLGVDADTALNTISDGAFKAISAVDGVAKAVRASGADAATSSRAIEMALAAAVPKADSMLAIDALNAQMEKLAKSGQLSAEGLARTKEALEKQRSVIEGQLPGIQSLGEALRQLGVKPQAELKALAASAKEAFDKVKESGTATPREINEAWKAMAEAAIKANDGVADSTIKSQAAAHGFAIKTDEAGKSIIESMKKAEDATRAVGAAAQSAAEQMDGMANVAWKAGGDLVAQARAHNAALGELKGTWIDATAAASRYSAEMAELVYNANKNVEEMRREHAQLVEQMEALARQQQQLQDQGNGAARGVEDLRLRLVELDGTEEEVARARMERDKANILRQRALLDLELKRAMLRQDDEEAARLREEIALYNEQLVLLDQVFAKEEKQRKAKASNAGGERSGGGSSGSSDSSSGGIGAGTGTGGSATYNITVNANGINDPVQLARQLVPELKKLDRLAR